MPWSKDWSGLKAAEAIVDRLSIQRKDGEDLLPCMMVSTPFEWIRVGSGD